MKPNSIWARIRLFLRMRLPKPNPDYLANQEKLDQDYILKIRGDNKIPRLRQLKYLRRFYNEPEILITKIALLLILVSLLTLGANIYFNNLERLPAVGGEYREAVIGAPTYINPLFSQTNDVDQDLTTLIFSSLMKTDENGQLIPDLAENYSIDEENKIYTFTLKPNIKWHDGENLTAADVLFTVNSIKDQNFKSPLNITFRNVDVQMVDERTIRFTLPEPFSPFLSVFTFGIIPEHLWRDIEPSHAILSQFNLKPVGSGPFQFESLVKDKNGNIREYRLKRFKYYFTEGPFIEKISLKFFGSLEEADQALLTGNVDGIGFLPRSTSNDPTNDKSKKGYNFSLPQYSAIFFNQASNPALTEKNVRLALSLATSRQQIIDSAFAGDKATAVYNPILPGFVGNDPNASSILFDPAQAAEILDNAGWTRVAPEQEQGKENSPQKNETAGQPQDNVTLGVPDADKQIYIRRKKIKNEDVILEIDLTTVEREENIKVAEKIRDLWQDIGIKVNLQIVATTDIQKDVIKPRAYEALLFGQILGRDPDPYPFWHSSQANYPGLNLALYANKPVDRLLEEARQTSDNQIRTDKYIEFQKKLTEDIPAIFLYSLNYIYILPKEIQGVNTNTIHKTSDRFRNVADWYIKTKKRIRLDF